MKTSIFLLFFLFSCVPTYDLTRAPEGQIHPMKSEWDGRQITFNQISESLQKYFGTDGWKYLNGNSTLKYNELVGENGFVEGIIVDKKRYKFWVVKLTNGKKIIKKFGNDYKWGFIDDTYFVDDYEVANKLVDSSIWLYDIKDNYSKDEKLYVFKNIFIDGEGQRTNFKRFQKVRVIEIVPFVYGNTYHGNPFYLKIQGEDGEIGYVRYGKTKIGVQSRLVHYYIKNPISDKWSEEIISLIKKGKIKMGMKSEQVSVSWGNPNKINKSIGSWGVHEQWIYKGHYVYFENGILTSLQTK